LSTERKHSVVFEKSAASEPCHLKKLIYVITNVLSLYTSLIRNVLWDCFLKIHNGKERLTHAI